MPETPASPPLTEYLDKLAYHPATPETAATYQRLRSAAMEFEREVYALCPHSRERSLSFTAIEEALMRANQSVAVNQTPAAGVGTDVPDPGGMPSAPPSPHSAT